MIHKSHELPFAWPLGPVSMLAFLSCFPRVINSFRVFSVSSSLRSQWSVNDSLAVQLVSTSHNKQVLIGSRFPALKFSSPAVVTFSAKLPSLRLLAVLTWHRLDQAELGGIWSRSPGASTPGPMQAPICLTREYWVMSLPSSSLTSSCIKCEQLN